MSCGFALVVSLSHFAVVLYKPTIPFMSGLIKVRKANKPIIFCKKNTQIPRVLCCLSLCVAVGVQSLTTPLIKP